VSVGLAACGDSGPTTPPTPTPAPGRWVGAQRIDAGTPTNPSCSGATAPVAGMDGSGRAVATWLSDCVIWVAGASREKPWSPPSPLGGLPPGAPANWLWDPALAVSRGGVALVAWAAQESAAEGRQLFSRRLDPVAGWTSAERIDGGEARRLGLPYAPSLALDESGNGLAAWDSEGVVAARLSAARGWLAPERIAGPPSSVPFVFLDRSGSGFATWSLRGEAYARRFEPAGGWGETTRFTPEAGWSFSGWGDLAFDAAGQALLVWSQAQGSIGPQRVWSAAYGGGRWSAGVVVSTGGGSAVNPHVGIDGAGAGLAVWNESQAGIASARWERGAWAPPQLVVSAPVGAGPVRLAVSTGGDAMVAWRETDSAGRGRALAVRYAGGSWGSPEALQASGNQPGEPMVAVDPCGYAVATWAEYEADRKRVWANRYETACTGGGATRRD
jgi:hypothetical protein